MSIVFYLCFLLNTSRFFWSILVIIQAYLSVNISIIFAAVGFVALVLTYFLLCSQGNYKRMDGNQGGSREKTKTDPSGTRVDIGNIGSRENGMVAQIFSVNSLKTLLILMKGPDCNSGAHLKRIIFLPCFFATPH